MTRFICTGWKTFVTGVFPGRSGGDTGFRLTIAMNVARWLYQEACRRNVRSADVHTLLRMRIPWIPGFPLRCGRSLYLDGRIRRKNWIILSDGCTGYRIRHHFLLGNPYGIFRIRAYRKGSVPHRIYPRPGAGSLGRKMSKSLGNGIDPLEIIDQYGADACV